jgi:MFS family permease
VIHALSTSFLDLALLSLALLLLFCLVFREQRVPKEAVPPFRLTSLSRWSRPFTQTDFALIWGARCLVFLATTTVINYLFSFLHTEHLFAGSQVASGVQLFYTIYVMAILVSSLVCGKISDLLQRRKPFVIGASLIIASGVALLAFFPILPVVLSAAAVIGCGFGAYLSADLALASQVLPEAQSRGRDLGWMNSAIFLPMLLAPLLAGGALNLFHSYALLFTMLTIGVLGAATLMIPVKTVG